MDAVGLYETADRSQEAQIAVCEDLDPQDVDANPARGFWIAAENIDLSAEPGVAHQMMGEGYGERHDKNWDPILITSPDGMTARHNTTGSAHQSGRS